MTNIERNKVIETKPKSPLKIKKEVGEDGVIKLKPQNIKNLSEFTESLCVSDEDMANILLNQLMWAQDGNGKTDCAINAAYAMYQGIEPEDSIECLLATQMVATHNIAMELAKRAMLPEQTIDGVNANINRVTKLMRTFAAQVETLKKYRTGGKQTIQVQHVNVNEGGQAIVGDVKGRG
jgi:hypothetical protein